MIRVQLVLLLAIFLKWSVYSLESRYAPDARLHMVYLRNLFAEYELNIAHFYLVRHAYIAASNRAYYILQNYQQTPSVEGALIVLVQADQAMGLIPEESSKRNVYWR